MQPTGKLYFIGAGPGDPSLLTIKAAKVLAKADVVITDRLVSEDILTEHVNPRAEIIPVGKQGGSAASTSQKEINELLIEYANQYKIVVRLKGGDVSLFSNILDELQTVTEAGIEYEIVPGISAISGASAYSGIPLTARGLATGVRILTYHHHTAIPDNAWTELATFKDTLVFYMSGKSLHHVVSKLLEAGAEGSVPFVVVEQATTPNQFVHEYKLQEFFYASENTEFISPALVIIGKVTSLYRQFAWLPNGERNAYFTNLEELTKAIEINNGYQNYSHVSRA